MLRHLPLGVLPLAFLLLAVLIPCGRANAQAKNTCVACHSKLDPPLQVSSADYTDSIHAQKGITCVTCHGGDSSSDDMSHAMSKAAGFRGEPERKLIPEFCGKCHSDAAYMRGFDPSLRTDQYSQYQTSVHGKLHAKGDTRTAVCTDCHGVHDIQPPSDQRSRVHPLNVAQTCSRCHANVEYMKSYGIATNQFADYSASVHHDALVFRGDLSAPTCSTCHGSHGAAPPGVESVARVCSTCHVFQAQLFDSGPHKQVFHAAGLPACVTCHSNHRVQHPTDAMIGTAEGSICLKCHVEGDDGYVAAAAIHDDLVKLDSAIGRSNELLSRAESSGMEVSEAKLNEAEARDDLMKARVEIHSVRRDAVDRDIDAGLKVAASTYQAGLNALAELRYRRRGLLVSVVAIGFVLIGLFMMIRKLESKDARK
jgi:hypothetical protein